MEISAQMVKELRESTGAGMMDCKKALTEANGDMEKAVDILREKGLGQAAKKADRLASEGLVSVVVCDHCKTATISEINSETDFVAKNAQFQNLTKDTTAHIQINLIKDVESLNSSVINGVKFEDYFKSQIATIGENLVVRRFETIKADDKGVVNGYVHSNGRVGVLIGLACESAEIASKAAEFARNLCMHAAAMKPSVISYKDLDKEFVEKEFIALRAELEKDNEELKRLGKPLHHIPEYASRCQIGDAELGKIERFYADNTVLDQRLTLLGQFYVMDDKKTIEQVVEEKGKELGGKIEVVKYVRFELGEGLEKKNEDFAAEVAAQIG